MKPIRMLFALLALSASALAGPTTTRVPSTELPVGTIDKKVGGLTAIQKFKIELIMVVTHAKLQALPPEDRRSMGAEIRRSGMAEVRKQLTADQQKKFDQK